jgi:DNA primase large subunit
MVKLRKEAANAGYVEVEEEQTWKLTEQEAKQLLDDGQKPLRQAVNEARLHNITKKHAEIAELEAKVRAIRESMKE